MARIVGHPRPGPAQAPRRPGVSPDDTLGSMPDPLLLLPDFLLIVCGYLICRHTPLDRTVWDGVEKLVYYALFPTLLFTSIVRYPQQPAELLPLAAAGKLSAEEMKSATELSQEMIQKYGKVAKDTSRTQ
jgi:hypothetical protein